MKQDNPTVVCLIIDGVGIKTLEYLLDNSDSEINLPNLMKLGLGNLLNPRFHNRVSQNTNAQFSYAIQQASASADSTIGHREIVGIIDPNTYQLFYNSFPQTFISELEKRIRRKTLFNQMAGGIEAIELNHTEHTRTGSPIVYASKCDPLIQIATDEDIISPEEAHKIIDTAFELAMEMKIRITRAISRTYVIKNNQIIRTSNRYDRVLGLPQPTLIDVLNENQVATISVGKPAELIPTSWSDKIKLSHYKQRPELKPFSEKETNPYSIAGTLYALKKAKTLHQPVFIFTNLVDTDSVYGHSQETQGSLRSLQQTDSCLLLLFEQMKPNDLLIITADHGMEYKRGYGYHSIEPLPFLATRINPPLQIKPKSLTTLASVGYLVAQTFGCEKQYSESCDLAAVFRN